MIVRDDEFLDFSKVPESRGIPPMLYRVVMIGILGIFAVGAACVFTAGYGHAWPAAQSQRPNLGTLHEGQ